MKRIVALLCSLALAVVVLAGCGGNNAGDTANNNDAGSSKLVVGATAKPHAEILEVVKPMLQEKGVDLEIQVFTDYVLLNPALKDKQIDANFFQHIPYLDDYNANNNADLVWSVKVHTEPMGVYSNKIDNLDNLADGAKIGIPNDATNGGRALNVLEAAGLLTLREGAGVTATDADIVENPKNLTIQMMDAAMLPRALADLDVCVINSNYALEANLNPVEDAIFMEAKDSPFANIVAVRAEDKDKEAIKKLGEALQSPEVKQFIEDNYKGSVIPAF
ncbi:MetQ/NlpA family ABC transporter substrate-binding protein [Desulfallas thermosapovorans]|uniref:Lipoprotein n=1 Tax=Desulfallas thermosapovorans DSM 6562 TaxID=1121431 RepID=A0A5S4ZR34_9FIRM|nr:MetQ/NlpA family ABC transporter substrate-binding protein [Desulfallas thermosapovorans]TYO95355.1 D-methionine transport system substrate-binding protein [Desulfallas thermosapovorans DSM 6562]